jgi:hypothetical protein
MYMTDNQTSCARTGRDSGRAIVSHPDVGVHPLARHYAAPHGLPTAAPGLPLSRLGQVVAGWRSASYARTRVPAPGPACCRLTLVGSTACGSLRPAQATLPVWLLSAAAGPGAGEST